MRYTPREIAGWAHFISKGKKREYAENLSLGAMASRGDPKELKKIIKDAEKD